MRSVTLTGPGPSVAFLLALFGFGAKAGPLAAARLAAGGAPARPSPVSALMSGVMLKTAIYGLLRVPFDLMPAQAGGGACRARAGSRDRLFGVVFAAVQTT
jgi:formate hydrogenlyase subunit 3/multisubunit Na+/H+ antiporter MnhD subunit